MPLYPDNPVLMQLVLDSLNDSVGSDGGDTQAVAQIPDGLVMRRVDLDVECAVLIHETGNGSELSDLAARLDPRGVNGVGRIRRTTLLAVLDTAAQFAGNVLVERTAEANVEALAAVADG